MLPLLFDSVTPVDMKQMARQVRALDGPINAATFVINSSNVNLISYCTNKLFNVNTEVIRIDHGRQVDMTTHR